jgi:hypothetical protein
MMILYHIKKIFQKNTEGVVKKENIATFATAYERASEIIEV